MLSFYCLPFWYKNISDLKGKENEKRKSIYCVVQYVFLSSVKQNKKKLNIEEYPFCLFPYSIMDVHGRLGLSSYKMTKRIYMALYVIYMAQALHVFWIKLLFLIKSYELQNGKSANAKCLLIRLDAAHFFKI